MPEENIPLTSRIIHLPLASRSGHHTRYAPLPVRGSVHLSRQFLEKLTESAIIKVALREDLSEVATGCGGLRLHPAVGEGCRRWRGTGSSNPSPSSSESFANLTSSRRSPTAESDGRVGKGVRSPFHTDSSTERDWRNDLSNSVVNTG